MKADPKVFNALIRAHEALNEASLTTEDKEFGADLTTLAMTLVPFEESVDPALDDEQRESWHKAAKEWVAKERAQL